MSYQAAYVVNPANADKYHILLPKGWRGGKRVILARTGAGPDVLGHQADAFTGAAAESQEMLLAKGGFPVIEMGGGSYAGWGNTDSQAAVDAAWTYAINVLGCKNDKLLFFGASAGFPTFGNWALRHPASVACLMGGIPACDLDWIHDTNLLGLQASINTAYGGNDAAWEAVKVSYDPHLRPTSYQPDDFPCKLFPVIGDPILPIQQARDFAAASGCEISEQSGTIHHTLEIDYDELSTYAEEHMLS